MGLLIPAEERPSDYHVKLAMKLGYHAAPGFDYLDVMMMARDMIRGNRKWPNIDHAVDALAALRWPEGIPLDRDE